MLAQWRRQVSSSRSGPGASAASMPDVIATAWPSQCGQTSGVRIRPGHVGKTSREERRGRFHDVMFRLVPCDIMRFLLAADFAEADGGLHPVHVAMHGLRHRLGWRNIRIGRDIKQIGIVPQPPQQAIEGSKTLAVAMQDCGLRDEEGTIASP